MQGQDLEPVGALPVRESWERSEARVRHLEKLLRSAAHRQARAVTRQDALAPYLVELQSVEVARQEAERSLARSQVAAAFGRDEAERLLRTYLQSSERAFSPSASPLSDWRAVYGQAAEENEDGWLRFADEAGRKPGVAEHSAPRSRDVFGRRTVPSARGRHNGQPIHSRGKRRLADLHSRIELQRAMRLLPERSRLVLFLHAVAGATFKDIGAELNVTAQAAQKAYRKALGELTDVLNGFPPGVGARPSSEPGRLQQMRRLAELRDRETALRSIAAEHLHWSRLERKMARRLADLEKELAQIQLPAGNGSILAAGSR